MLLVVARFAGVSRTTAAGYAYTAMSILPRTYDSGKKCLVYCGDDNCTCECSPHHPNNIAFFTEGLYMDEATRNLEERKLDEQIEALERFNESLAAQQVEEAEYQRNSVQVEADPPSG
jgi:hypothetical protein